MAAENPASGAAELVTAFCKVCKSPAGGAGVVVVVVDKKLNIVDGTLTVVVVVVVVVEVVDSVVEDVLAKEVDDLTVDVVVDIVVVVKSFKWEDVVIILWVSTGFSVAIPISEETLRCWFCDAKTRAVLSLTF